MRILLDSCALIWWFHDSARLSVDIIEAIANPKTEVFVSIASLWEIEIKRAIGKLNIVNDFHERILNQDMNLLPITVPHLAQLKALPCHHNDPFDRMIIAQAMVESLKIVTLDKQITLYDVVVMC